ncbi:hypothetical protein D1872_281130 [compost metagenome]
MHFAGIRHIHGAYLNRKLLDERRQSQCQHQRDDKPDGINHPHVYFNPHLFCRNELYSVSGETQTPFLRNYTLFWVKFSHLAHFRQVFSRTQYANHEFRQRKHSPEAGRLRQQAVQPLQPHFLERDRGPFRLA